VKRTLRRLIIAGHSRAYLILTPLALEFHQRTALTKTTRHLGKLEEVWSLDSAYGQRHVRALDAWASACPSGRFVAVQSRQRGLRSLVGHRPERPDRLRPGREEGGQGLRQPGRAVQRPSAPRDVPGAREV